MTRQGDQEENVRQSSERVVKVLGNVRDSLFINGDNNAVELHFHAVSPLPPVSREDLLTVIHQANAELRTYPNDIAGVHIERAEVAQIVEWALKADPKERLGMLLDRPGSGKTVVMRGVLERLEAAGVPVLAIKADTLSGVASRSDLADRLGLPVPVEECARSLVSEGLFIVVLDQLDALSLTLSRDQATLDVMLSTLAHLRDINGVRIVASCRTFDLNNDPRLSAIKVDRRFQLRPLDEAKVDQVLRAIGVDPDHLLPAHKELLTVPLHFGVYARIVIDEEPEHSPESFRTLQELYEALWRKRIEAFLPDTPPPSERVAAIYQLVEAMQDNHRVIAPVAVLDSHLEAAKYLEGEGLIRREGGNWLFFHQTFFDYCYARRFVAQGWSLSQEILSGPQGLFERSQMVQVVAYLRGTDQAAYRRELTTLLFADELRVHLHLLLIGWFGSLPDPVREELGIVRRLIADTEKRVQFLQAINGNKGWFDLLNEEEIPSLLRSDDEQFLDLLAIHLSTLIQQRTDAVLARLRPYLGQSETWDARIALCLAQLNDWRNEDAVDMLCDLLRRNRTGGRGRFCFRNLAGSNPAAGCRALRCYLDRRLDDLLAQEQAEREEVNDQLDPTAAYRIGVPNRFAWNQRLLGEHAIGEVMEQAVQHCPEAVVEHLLPWFLRAVSVLTESTDEREDYPWDPLFATGWYGEYLREGAIFARRVADALGHMAQTHPETFRAIADELMSVESLAVQRVLVQAYLADPETYANDIVGYLTADVRRLRIGEAWENPHYDSYCLFGAVFAHASEEQRAELEKLILSYVPEWEKHNPQSRGLTHLQFLKSVPRDLLGDQARDRLGELERKFPGSELRPPRGVVGGWVGPPIEQAAQAKMSDDDWLGAMRRYDDSTAGGAPREDPFKGGVIELSRAFAEQVKNNPERFYRLAQRFDETTSLHYIEKAISGLAESDAPAEWVFDLVRRFASRIEGEFRGKVCWALKKRADDDVPDDLLDLMVDWALHDPNPTEELWRTIPAGSGQPYYGGDPYIYGINTNRGVAIQAVCHCARRRKPPQTERVFRLLEQAANDSSTAVRTCVIEGLLPLLNEDDERALAIFERALDGHPRLLQTDQVYSFLYWTYYHHFPRIRPFVEALLANADEATRQAGARLACLAAFRYPKARVLARQVIGPPMHRPEEGFKRTMLVAVRRLQFRLWRFMGHRRDIVKSDVAMRRGAAQVYARNLGNQDADVGDVCRKWLLQLMNDPDEQVRVYVGECFKYLNAEHMDSLRPFIEQFLASPALMDGARHLAKYLAPLAADVPDLVLMMTERILDTAGSEVTNTQKAASILERYLVQLLLTVYTHTSDSVEKSKAMDLFERLLLWGSRIARKALKEWDRR